MSKRHKHADVIIAWAEGKDVQVWDCDNQKWLDVTVEKPLFTWDKYRIKPPAKKYRVALLRDNSESYALSVNNQEDADSYEKDRGFIRWLTDWIEYEE